MSDKRNIRFHFTTKKALENHGDYVGRDMIESSYTERSHVNASIESSGTTPIDITLMTGNGGNTDEGE